MAEPTRGHEVVEPVKNVPPTIGPRFAGGEAISRNYRFDDHRDERANHSPLERAAFMTREQTLREIERLLARVKQLEGELARDYEPIAWPPPYYTTHHVLAGCVLGAFGAAVSLLANIIGSLLIHQEPLRLIRVYLTFPLGAEALVAASDVSVAIGCCLYLVTGMILGVPFQLVLSRWLDRDSFAISFGATTALALGLWLFNFYGVLSWLQPLLFGGCWIVDDIPWWVAALTHVLFGWTILLAQPLGAFTPYRSPSEKA